MTCIRLTGLVLINNVFNYGYTDYKLPERNTLHIEDALRSSNDVNTSAFYCRFFQDIGFEHYQISRYNLFSPVIKFDGVSTIVDVNMKTFSIPNLMFLMLIVWPLFMLARLLEDVIIDGLRHVSELLGRYSKQFIINHIKSVLS